MYFSGWRAFEETGDLHAKAGGLIELSSAESLGITGITRRKLKQVARRALLCYRRDNSL